MEFPLAAILDPSEAPAVADGAGVGRVAGEADLIVRAKADPEAFAVLYRRHYRAVVGCLYRRTGDTHVAEDLASETFVAAYRAIRRYRPGAVPFRYWLLRIATNAASRWSRRQARAGFLARARAAILPTVMMPAGGTEHHASGDVERLHQVMRRLPSALQSVISLHYFEGLSVEEAAEVLGCPVGTVKSRLSRGRAALRELLGEESRP